MFRKILTYGALAGVVVGMPLFGVTVGMNVHPPSPYDAVFGYLTMLVALSAVIVAFKRHRDVQLGGVIKYWSGSGLGISVLAGLLYVLARQAALAVTHMDFAGEYARVLLGQQQAKGITGEALARFVADMEQFKAEYANPLFRLPMTLAEIFPVEVILSLVSAGLLRNSRFLPAQQR